MRPHAAAMARALVVALVGIASAHGDPGADHADLHARYAAARLRFAEARLEKAERLNRQTPGLLTETDMRRLRSRVAVLRELVTITHDRPHGHAAAVQQAVASATRRIAEEDLAAAKAARQRQPAAVPAADLKQLELKVEIAALQTELLEDPRFLESPIDVMQMQIDQLADLILDSVDRIETAPGIDRP